MKNVSGCCHGRAINHFCGDFERRPSKLSPEEIGKFYDNFVPASVDVIPVISAPSGKKILLGLRREHPRIWWTIGRGIIPGESPIETANRALKEEFGIKSGFAKFDFVCVNSFAFPLRRHPPQENGRHSLVIVLSLSVSKKDMRLFRSQSGKYREIKWFPLFKIDTSNFDPVICATASCL